MKATARGFTLIELIAVMILVGILSAALFSRMDFARVSAVQSSRDDLIAALFFAQQQAMMRPKITLVVTANSVSVNDDGTPILPLAMPMGVSLMPRTAAGATVLPMTFTYDRLGRTTSANITINGSGNSAGVSARIQVEASGYAFAN